MDLGLDRMEGIVQTKTKSYRYRNAEKTKEHACISEKSPSRKVRLHNPVIDGTPTTHSTRD
jgi:hypothetical protein